ncbi:uncharacterized protein [Antennarius striatus]|uniref:uncharacterized protein n=1 Tax=Antennarius striatus TaxID=241820 RepID=UPI0035B1B695
MDPADPTSPQSRLALVEAMLQQHESLLASNAAEARQSASSLERALTSLAAQVQQMAASMAQHAASVPVPAPPAPTPVPASSSTSEPRVGAPERYDGDPEGCNPFLTNCSILFALQPHTFATEGARVAFAINHLTGRARLWGTAEWERGTPACATFQAFGEELRKVFGPVSLGPDAAGGLMSQRQGDRTVSDYAIDFRTRARLSDWNAATQCDAFLNGLAPYVKDELVPFDLPNSLDGLIELTTRLDRRIQTRRKEQRRERGKLTCLLSLTSCFASAPLVSACSFGFDSSAWPRLFSCLFLNGTSAFTDCSPGFDLPACPDLSSAHSSSASQFVLPALQNSGHPASAEFFARRGLVGGHSDAVMAYDGFTSLTRSHGIRVVSPCSVEEVALVVGDVIGCSVVKSADQGNSSVRGEGGTVTNSELKNYLNTEKLSRQLRKSRRGASPRSCNTSCVTADRYQ